MRIWLEIAQWREERSQPTRERAMRAVFAGKRACPLAVGEPRGSPRRLGEAVRDRVVRVRGGLLVVAGRLWAAGGGPGGDGRVGG